MLKEERWTLILRMTEGRDAVSYDDLLGTVEASGATLRRDVEELTKQGLVRKIRGGVAPLERAPALQPASPLPSYFFLGEKGRNAEAKDAVGRAAQSLCQEGDSLILFGGTTVYRFAELLPHSTLTILTNSLPVVNFMTMHTSNRVFMTGGEVLVQQGIVLSPFDDGETGRFAARTFFIGCHGVSSVGIMENDPLPVHVFHRLRLQASRLVVLVDSSKFSSRRSMVICGLGEIDTLVTDDGLSDRDHKMLIEAGVNVLIGSRADGGK